MTAERDDRQAAPPRLATWIAGLRAGHEAREFQIGDLVEEFHERAAAGGLQAARRWYWRQARRNLIGRRRDCLPRSPRPRGLCMSNAFHDALFAWRLMRRAPAASAAVVLTFALGIGANVAMFSVAWPVLFAPLPFPDEARLTLINLEFVRNTRRIRNPVSAGDYSDLRGAASFEAMASFNQFSTEWNLTGHGDAAQVDVAFVNDEFFTVLGVRPIAGRTLQKGDAGGTVPLVVLKERLWRTMFGGDPAIVGRTLQLNGTSYVVAGVVPDTAGLGTRDADVWVHRPDPPNNIRRAYFLGVVARLRPGVSLEAANQELAAIMARAATEFPESNQNVSARADPLRERIAGPVRPTYLLLLASSAFVLLIAATNLIGLQLARGLTRDREMRIRQALGASRTRLVRLMLIEHVTLALCGGAAGLLCASVSVSALGRISPALVRIETTLAQQPIAILFTLALSIAAGLAVGLLPAWRASGVRGSIAIQARASTPGRAAARARSGVVGLQVALTVMLLIVATFVTASLARVLTVDPGFDLTHGIVADVTLPASRYGSVEAKRLFFDRLVERVEAVPGVERACASNDVPLDNPAFTMTYVAEGAKQLVTSFPKTITPGCFETLRIEVLRGRAFRETEPDRVAIVSETMARQLWPDGGDVVGRRIHLGLPTGDLMTVVGVVRDIRNASLESAAEQQVWMPHTMDYFPPQRLIVRSATPPGQLAPTVRAALREIDPGLALANVRTMGDVVARATSSRRFLLALLGSFGVMALGLSAVGIYGVLAHMSGQRTREIGIRMALGARRSDVIRLVGGPVAIAILAGAAIGTAGAWSGSRYFASLLFRMSATDARIYVGVVLFVAVVALLAAWVPTRRAARLNPVHALQE